MLIVFFHEFLQCALFARFNCPRLQLSEHLLLPTPNPRAAQPNSLRHMKFLLPKKKRKAPSSTNTEARRTMGGHKKQKIQANGIPRTEDTQYLSKSDTMPTDARNLSKTHAPNLGPLTAPTGDTRYYQEGGLRIPVYDQNGKKRPSSIKELQKKNLHILLQTVESYAGKDKANEMRKTTKSRIVEWIIKAEKLAFGSMEADTVQGRSTLDISPNNRASNVSEPKTHDVPDKMQDRTHRTNTSQHLGALDRSEATKDARTSDSSKALRAPQAPKACQGLIASDIPKETRHPQATQASKEISAPHHPQHSTGSKKPNTSKASGAPKALRALQAPLIPRPPKAVQPSKDIERHPRDTMRPSAPIKVSPENRITQGRATESNAMPSLKEAGKLEKNIDYSSGQLKQSESGNKNLKKRPFPESNEDVHVQHSERLKITDEVLGPGQMGPQSLAISSTPTNKQNPLPSSTDAMISREKEPFTAATSSRLMVQATREAIKQSPIAREQSQKPYLKAGIHGWDYVHHKWSWEGDPDLITGVGHQIMPEDLEELRHHPEWAKSEFRKRYPGRLANQWPCGCQKPWDDDDSEDETP